MKQNPYQNQVPARKQLANVDVEVNGKITNHTVVCFSNDCEDVIYSKARKKAMEHYGSHIENVALKYNIKGRENI